MYLCELGCSPSSHRIRSTLDVHIRKMLSSLYDLYTQLSQMYVRELGYGRYGMRSPSEDQTGTGTYFGSIPTAAMTT